MNNSVPFEGPVCPLPLSNHEQILIGHGSGGDLTHHLIRKVFQNYLGNDILSAGNDAALIQLANFQTKQDRLVVSTDAHIITPLFFAGGDIGRLAVCGTVNDVAMMGAKPLYLTATFILEEGFLISDLEKILVSIQKACLEAGVQIVAADTKVTEKGKSDGMFISTTGFGLAPNNRLIAGDQANVGDAVLLTGPIGNHGIAIAEARGNLGFKSGVKSDIAPLNQMLAALLAKVPDVHVMRDPTRGGLATTLVEIAQQSSVTIDLIEDLIPIDPPVRNACAMLGLDPLYLANEGKAIIILPQARVELALRILKKHNYGKNAARIGTVTSSEKSRLLLRTPFGTRRVLEMLTGEMLPRIC